MINKCKTALNAFQFHHSRSIQYDSENKQVLKKKKKTMTEVKLKTILETNIIVVCYFNNLT